MKEVLLGVTTMGVFGVLSWMAFTLISVDKRTEVMASQISFIKEHMERNYGNVEGANATTSFQATFKK